MKGFPALLCYNLFFWLLLLFPLSADCQESGDVDPRLQARGELIAPVRVDGTILFYVRGVTSFPADIRAKTIIKRIAHAAADYTISTDSVKIIETEDKMKVYVGHVFIMNVYQADAEADGIDMKLHAEIIGAKIKASLKEYRLARTPAVVKANIRKAFAASGILLVCILLFVLIFHRLNEVFKKRIKSRIDALENVSFKLIQSTQLLKVLHVFYKLVRLIIIIIITITFLNYILGLFPRTKTISIYMLELVLDPIRSIGNSFIEYLPSLIFLVIIFLFTQYLLKLIRLFFVGIRNGGIEIQNFDPEWAMPTFKIAKFLVIILAAVIAFPYIPGSDTSAFQGISVFLGVLFSLGSSSFIANVIAGYSMTYRRAFKKGDRIQINDFMGFVEEQSLMVTRLRSAKNEEIVIPNSIMLNSSLVNYSIRAKEKGIILHTTVSIGYQTPWRQVEAMLKQAADRTNGLLKDPPPYVLYKELGGFAVLYEINAYCNDPINMYYIYTELHKHILDIFNENNVQIMTPAYEGDPETPKVVPKEQWDTPLAGNDKSA